MAKMTLFNFDSTSAVLKFETFKIAVFVNDLDFMFPPAEFKRFVLFKFEDSAEETIVYYSMQANSPLRGLKKSVGCHQCATQLAVTSPRRMSSRAILCRKQTSSPRLRLGPYFNIILMEELIFPYLDFCCTPFLPTFFM